MAIDSAKDDRREEGVVSQIGELEEQIRQRQLLQESLEERLKFERLLSNLSAAFVSVPAGDIDREIKRWLKRLVEFLEIDGSSISEALPDGSGYTITHFYSVPGFQEPPIRSSQLVPWYTEKLASQDILVIERVPKSVPIEQARLWRDVKLHVAVPLKVGQTKLGMIGFASRRKKPSWSDERLQRLRLIGEIFANAIERKRTEETLRRREEQLRLMADSLPALISYVDSGQRFQFNNTAYQKRCRLPVDKIKGYTLGEVLGDTVYAAVREHVERALAGEETRFETEIPGFDGSIRHFEASYVPHFDSAGQVLGFYALEHDVTDRKRVELEVQRNRDELAHVTRVAMLDELAASLAHELNQPLAAILSNAQAAQRFLALDKADLDEVREALADIVKDDWRAAKLIRKLRELVKKRDYERTSIDINRVVREVMKLVRSDAVQKKVSIVLELADGLPSVTGDYVQLQQVLLNLALNGFSAMSRTEEKTRKLLVSTFREAPDVVAVSVRDHGIGMDQSTMEHMFDAFFTTRSEGLGMGLSISRTIIEAHGGRIWAERKPDGGVAFTFTLSADVNSRF
ncbi:MAG: PAS domain-containing protein [Proteobacteria bacterium]|nr:PAS domain-containing protein [Pseudomonadota bacterium]